MLAGESARAHDCLEEALALRCTPAQRAEVLALRARLAVVIGDGHEVLPMLEREMFALRDIAPAAAGAALLDLVVPKLYAGHTDALDVVEQALGLIGEVDPLTRARADTIRGFAEMFAGRHAEAYRLLEHSPDMIRLGGSADEVAHLLQSVVVGMSSLERYAEAMTLCRRYVRSVRAIGADGLLPILLCYLSNTAYFVSDFAEQEMAAAEAAALAQGLGQASIALYAQICEAIASGIRGNTYAARDQLEAACAGLDDSGMRVMCGLALLGLGLLAMGDRAWGDAVKHYAELRVFLKHLQFMPGVLHWRADEIEALWRDGQIDLARGALAEFVAALPLMGPWDRATAYRAQALLATDEEAETLFERALAAHEHAASPFERARTELCWGEWLVGQDRPEDAHSHLERARTIFADLEARAWRRHAEDLLASTSPDPDRLTYRKTTVTQVRAFGPLTVVRNGVPVPVPLDQPGRLLRHLVVAGGVTHVDQLAAMLWPDVDPGGSARLRNVIARTRRTYGPIIVRTGTILRWAEEVEVDAHRFEELAGEATRLRSGPAAAALAQQAVELYRADLIPMERYTEEVVDARHRLRRRYLAMLDLLADEELRGQRPEAATALLRRALDADPADEMRYAKLAALLLDQGDLAGARGVLAGASRTAIELDVPVSPRIVELERRLAAVVDRR